MCINVFFPECIGAHYVCAWYPRRSEEGTGCPGTGLMDSCEPPCGCWESNLDPLQQQVLLTTEPSVRPPRLSILYMRKVSALRVNLSKYPERRRPGNQAIRKHRYLLSKSLVLWEITKCLSSRFWHEQFIFTEKSGGGSPYHKGWCT